jgi:K+-sensing histidine kinase KdpD
LKRTFKIIEEMKSKSIYCIIIALVVLVIDYYTGKNIRFPILYIIPIGIAAWGNKKTIAYSLAIALSLARFGFNFPWHETVSLFSAGINTIIRIVVLLLYAYLVARTAWQTRELTKKVDLLEGILPICASCKKIRNDKGEYEQIEQYISEHSKAEFSHGICPECAQKLYPEFSKKEIS